jgi:hypothetical protein
MPQFAERLLDHLDLSRVPICLTLNEPISAELDRLLEDLEILLGTPVQVFAIEELSQSELLDAFEVAGLIIFVGGAVEGWIERIFQTAYASTPELFLTKGKILVAIGAASSAMGSWALIDPTLPPIEGLNWLVGALILPGVENPMASPLIRDLLAEQDHSYALGLPQGTMIAFGPGGKIEMWGGTTPVIALGHGWGEV